MGKYSLSLPLFKSKIRSLIHRNNYKAIQDNHNELEDRVAAIISPPTREVLSTCDNLDGWNQGGAAIMSVDTSTKREGTGSIRVDKDVGNPNFDVAYYPPGGIVLDGKLITEWIFIADDATRDLMNGSVSYFDIGGPPGNYRRKKLGAVGQPFVTGWNQITMEWDNPDEEHGTVNPGMVVTYFETELWVADPDATFTGKIFVDDLYTGPGDKTETIDARGTFPLLRDRLESGFSVFSKAHISGGLVVPNSPVDMSVVIPAGECLIKGKGVKWATHTTPAVPAPTVFPRFDTVVVNIDGSVSYLIGVEEEFYPHILTLGDTEKKLAHIRMDPGMVSIESGRIRDARRESMRNGFFYGLPPIGSILAVDLAIPGAVEPGPEYVRASPGVVEDPESPLYGQDIPALNTGEYFIRPSVAPGGYVDDSLEGHRHELKAWNDPSATAGGVVGWGMAVGVAVDNEQTGSTTEVLSLNYDPANAIIKSMITGNSESTGDAETAPKHYTVVHFYCIK